MLEWRFVDIRVNCPGAPHQKPKKMQMRLVRRGQNEGWLPAPCNGCDDMNGAMPCEYCCKAVTDLFYRDPERDPSIVISP